MQINKTSNCLFSGALTLSAITAIDIISSTRPQNSVLCKIRTVASAAISSTINFCFGKSLAGKALKHPFLFPIISLIALGIICKRSSGRRIEQKQPKPPIPNKPVRKTNPPPFWVYTPEELARMRRLPRT